MRTLKLVFMKLMMILTLMFIMLMLMLILTLMFMMLMLMMTVMVFLQMREPFGSIFGGGASLIAPGIVLTAAHKVQ
jgi:hypothetical protein